MARLASRSGNFSWEKFRLPLALLCLAPALPAEESLASRLHALVEAPPLDRALVGLRVVELETGRVVFDHHGTTGFTPASNTKLFCGAFAMAKLGAAYRFQSSVRAGAEPDGKGVVRGDVTMVAGGDPTLSGRVYPFQSCRPSSDGGAAVRALAGQLAGRGVTRIEGGIVGDDTRYPFEPYGPEWTVEDAERGGEAPVSAWMVNDNMAGSGHDERSVLDPAVAVAEAFRQALMDQGIVVSGKARAVHRPPNADAFARAAGVELATRASPPLNRSSRPWRSALSICMPNRRCWRPHFRFRENL